jgi:poly(A) polymerase Pap1
MATSGAQLGVTEPLSMAFPTENENRMSNLLMEELRRQNNYESAADTNKRYVNIIKNPYPSTFASLFSFLDYFKHTY